MYNWGTFPDAFLKCDECLLQSILKTHSIWNNAACSMRHASIGHSDSWTVYTQNLLDTISELPVYQKGLPLHDKISLNLQGRNIPLKIQKEIKSA